MQVSIGKPGIALRPVTESDQAFLLSVYASTREKELEITGWSDKQKSSFIQMQFAAQQRSYFSYPSAEYLLILYEGQPAGRIYLQYKDAAILIIDLSLLPAFRNRGIGSCILTATFERAASLGQSVQIHVEKFNPALLLYQRLGFRLIEDKGVYLFMEWCNLSTEQQ
jgi:GNAT superfamily N-acetyltransferase